MSFQDKMSALMARPGQDPVSKDDVSWWMKFAGRGVGTVGGAIAIFLGIFNCVGLLGGSVNDLLSGVWQVIAGFIVICCEAPCCCMFIDHVQRFSDWIEQRPYWNRALGYVVFVSAVLSNGFETYGTRSFVIGCNWKNRWIAPQKQTLYMMLAIPPIAMCLSFSIIFGSGLIFTTGILYGMMALGKKASAEEMRQAASAENSSSRPTSSMHSNLVANAQPISFTGSPVFDSNV